MTRLASKPKSITRQICDEELECVVGLWVQRYKVVAPTVRFGGQWVSLPTYKWAQSIINASERLDVWPHAVVRRFPPQEPRRGWWGYLRWISTTPKPLEIGDLSFDVWVSEIAGQKSRGEYETVEVMPGIMLRIPKKEGRGLGDAPGLLV